MSSSLKFSPRTIFDEDHDRFREMVRTFIEREAAPHFERWEDAKIVDRSFYEAAGEQGLLLFAAPAELGGPDVDDFRFNAILDEEFGRAGMSSAGLGLALQNDVLGPYFLELTNDEQRRRWVPGLVAGTSIAAIAMTEPGTGSDLSGIRTRATLDGDHYVLNGAKTFISSGQNADLVVVAARTSDHPHRGLTLLVVEAGMEGFERGRNLDKLGLRGQDTSELSFTDVRVPVSNRLGDEGAGFLSLVRNLPQERMSLAVTAVACSVGMLEWTLDYVNERQAFGQSIGSFQNTRFTLSELATEVEIAQTFVDSCLSELVAKTLTPVKAAKAKWWTTELQNRVAAQCLQLHGGYGFMMEYPIARAYADARIQTIYGGTTEIMKEIIGRDLGL
ncbi:acyl-CoA dehydrogenase [Nocardioides marmoriginsengisoli]|uniref:Acyl-CoA dehydrogenase n=1 Tax=Nocardioides marmoriginsengisoli TaxID=661483 RepID=A0A3N0CIL5_9ACTN|nr:acyl-CoA dehydrogenase family protein [Nocardioides marmoriginsengisoli]RNL62783.1 acyl-CoA dehydrogenase [Nocardioides marmoriginsengisoli]